MVQLYNTMTRHVDEFHPLDDGKVSLYTCGPTVYNYAHIGNLRTYIFEDILKRVLKEAGWQVRHVMNVTDVGHLTSDADEGEDKMALGAQREGKSVWEIADFYWQAFRRDMQRLNLVEPDVWCKATDHIPEQIALIRALEAKGLTYPTEDGIYFDTSKLTDYGKLARLDIAGLRAGARIEMAAGKRNPTDFALWKFSPKDKKRLMEWESPWGVGFPGWHLECSAMAMKYLGERVDIHCGGIDHISVHHTNEIAQSESVTGRPWVNWWMHGEFLTIGEKMSKSSGNFIRLDTLEEKGYKPLAYRYFCLNAHYRQQLAFSWDALDAAQSAYRRLTVILRQLKDLFGDRDWKPERSEVDEAWLGGDLNGFRAAVEDDLNMPRALAEMWRVAQGGQEPAEKTYAKLLAMERILGLGIESMAQWNVSLSVTEIERLIEKRNAARKAKDYARADEIRKNLAEMGIAIKDGPQGTTWYRL